MVILTDENIKTQNLTIVFCLPGNTFTNNFLKGWTEIVMWCFYNNIKIYLSNHTSSNVYYVRNLCIGGDVLNGKSQKIFQGEIKYDYLMWIDSDQVFNVNLFKKLIYANKDIVSGLYKMQNSNSYATVQNWDKDYFKKHGCFEFINEKYISERRKTSDSDLMNVSYTGFGWMLVKKGVFESLEYPWFRPLWHTFNNKQEIVSDFSSEDVSWCKLVIEKGYKIWVDTTAIVGHEKLMII